MTIGLAVASPLPWDDQIIPRQQIPAFTRPHARGFKHFDNCSAIRYFGTVPKRTSSP